MPKHINAIRKFFMSNFPRSIKPLPYEKENLRPDKFSFTILMQVTLKLTYFE